MKHVYLCFYLGGTDHTEQMCMSHTPKDGFLTTRLRYGWKPTRLIKLANIKKGQTIKSVEFYNSQAIFKTF